MKKDINKQLDEIEMRAMGITHYTICEEEE
jgi:hypothetical protein